MSHNTFGVGTVPPPPPPMPGYSPQPPGPPAGSGRRRWLPLVAAGIIGGVIASPGGCSHHSPGSRYHRSDPGSVAYTGNGHRRRRPHPRRRRRCQPRRPTARRASRAGFPQAIWPKPSVRAVQVLPARRQGWRSCDPARTRSGPPRCRSAANFYRQAGDVLTRHRSWNHSRPRRSCPHGGEGAPLPWRRHTASAIPSTEMPTTSRTQPIRHDRCLCASV